MINTTSIEKRAEILRRFKGWLNEKIYQEIEDAMNELRKFHSGEKGVSKGIKTVIKESEAALVKAEKSLKGKEFLTVALSIGDFYKINKKLLIDTKAYIATLEGKYQKAYDDIDDQHIDAINEIKSIINTPIVGDSAKSELEKTLQTKDPIKNIGANENYGLITEAGFFDWFRKSLSKQDITDKMFEKRSKTFRDQSKQMVDMCKKLQTVLNSRVKILDDAINHRDIGDYIDGMGDYAKKFNDFELNFKTYYNNWLKKVYDHKMNERKKRDEELAKSEKERIEREEKDALLNQVNGVKPIDNITNYDDALINYVSKLFDTKKSLYATKLALRNSMNMTISVRFNPANKPENDEIFKNVPPETIKGKNILSDAKQIVAAAIEEYDLPEKEQTISSEIGLENTGGLGNKSTDVNSDDDDITHPEDISMVEDEDVKIVNEKETSEYWEKLLVKQNISKDKWIKVLELNMPRAGLDKDVINNVINSIKSKTADYVMKEIMKCASTMNEYDLAIKILSYSDQLESIDTDRSNKLLAIAEGILDGTR